MKKLLAMVLAAVMVLSLCSCATAEETVALRVCGLAITPTCRGSTA